MDMTLKFILSKYPFDLKVIDSRNETPKPTNTNAIGTIELVICKTFIILAQVVP
jgi:hypothetical protein